MEQEDFATRASRIARIAQGKWPQPRIQLMEEAGVFDESNHLDHDAIRRAIESDPTLIEYWLLWSADKRYGGPWFWRPSDDLKKACDECATFVVAELGMFKEIRRKKVANQTAGMQGPQP